MLLRYFYDKQLAHASYLVGCQATGEAMVIDPGRDIAPYLKEAEAEDLHIVAATETHIHADFVSGARELAEREDVTLFLSDEGDEAWKYQYLDAYDHVLLKDGDTFMIGNVLFEVMHTPGHTPEHIALMLTDTAGADHPMGIFTGDFVFVGSIGRPDLLEEAAGISGTAEPLARQMYASVQRFKALPDHLQVWPAHGAGSACGKGLGAIPSSTVGYEKLFNAALQHEDEEPFVRDLLSDQPEAPPYFAVMKRVNKEGPAVVGEQPVLEQLGHERIDSLLSQGATIIDVRPAALFAAGHIPGTINIPHDDSFVTWAGWLAPYEAPFYLIGAPDRTETLVKNLLSIGLDNMAGLFDTAVIETWSTNGRALQRYDVTTPDEIADRWQSGEVVVLDVRARSEWDEGHIPGARHVMLGHLPNRVSEIPSDQPVVVQCHTGNRSAIGASVLQAQGISNVMNLMGGIRDWERANLPVEHNETN